VVLGYGTGTTLPFALLSVYMQYYVLLIYNISRSGKMGRANIIFALNSGSTLVRYTKHIGKVAKALDLYSVAAGWDVAEMQRTS
jgi:hypothetical protein